MCERKHWGTLLCPCIRLPFNDFLFLFHRFFVNTITQWINKTGPSLKMHWKLLSPISNKNGFTKLGNQFNFASYSLYKLYIPLDLPPNPSNINASHLINYQYSLTTNLCFSVHLLIGLPVELVFDYIYIDCNILLFYLHSIHHTWHTWHIKYISYFYIHLFHSFLQSHCSNLINVYRFYGLYASRRMKQYKLTRYCFLWFSYFFVRFWRKNDEKLTYSQTLVDTKSWFSKTKLVKTRVWIQKVNKNVISQFLFTEVKLLLLICLN